MGCSRALKGLTVVTTPRPQLFLSILTSFSSDSGGICDFPTPWLGPLALGCLLRGGGSTRAEAPILLAEALLALTRRRCAA